MKTTAKHVARTAILAVPLLTAGVEANAFAYNTCNGSPAAWPDDTVEFQASNGLIGETALVTALQRWNQNPSNFNFAPSFDQSTPPEFETNNGASEVWFTSGNSPLLQKAEGGSFPAVAKLYWSNCEYIEADVVFNVGVSWTSSNAKAQHQSYGSSFRPLQTTAMHEFGHALGLGHEDDEYNIMGRDWTHIHVNGNTTRSYSGEDANDGAVFLYGLAANDVEDLSVSHWRYDSAVNGYSKHRRTGVFNLNGDLLSAWGGAEPRYRVKPGQQVKVEFTFENNGASTHSDILVSFYISGNSTISTNDALLKNRHMTLSPDDPYTSKTTVTIPSWASGYYWLGVVIDRDNSISEVSGANNATYIPIIVEEEPQITFSLDTGIY